MQSKYCSFHGIDTNSITTKADSERKQAFMDYITNGGFPEMQNLRNKRGYIQSLMEAIIQKDIQRRFKIRNVETLRKIAHHLLNNACQVVNYEELSTLLNVSDKTLKKYVDYLQQAFLVQLLTKHSFKSKNRIYNEKAYMVDVGLQGNRDRSMSDENIGWRLENVVYVELLQRCSADFLDVYYYKPDSRSKEVDFVVCNQNRAEQLVQVAYEIDTPKTWDRETSALVKAAPRLHCDNLVLVAFTNTRTAEVSGKTIQVYSALDWLLGKASSDL